jgi:hypothetical protein
MSADLIAQIGNIPVIIQGALGSALFTIILFVGQKITHLLRRKISESSTKRRREFLIEENLKLLLLLSNDFSTRGAFVSLLNFRATRKIFLALIWLALGLVGSSIIDIFGVVGYLGALYFLFDGLETCKMPALDEEKAKEQLDENKEEINNLENA